MQVPNPSRFSVCKNMHTTHIGGGGNHSNQTHPSECAYLFPATIEYTYNQDTPIL